MKNLSIILSLILLSLTGTDAKRVVLKNGGGDVPDNVVEYAWPSYPYLARVNAFDGQGFFRLRIDPESGRVSSVEIVKTTTRKMLDDCAIKAFLKWRFRPHSAKAVIIPVT